MEHDIITSSTSLPGKLPILPLEGNPLFPGMITQMIISKKRLVELIEKAEKNNGFLGLVMVREIIDNNNLRFRDLCRVGTVARIHKKINLPEEGQISVFLALLERFTIEDEIKFTYPLVAKVKYIKQEMRDTKNQELVALTRNLITETRNIIANNPLFSEEVRLNMINIDHPGQIADFITTLLNIKRDEQQDILETFDLHDRIIKVLQLIHREKKVMKLQEKIQTQISDKVDKHRREHFLREMIKEIKEELGEPVDGKSDDARNYKALVSKLISDKDTKAQLLKDIEKFEVLDTHNPEYSVLSTYLEKVTALPWQDPPKRIHSIASTQKILDSQHYGMEKVKERIIEHLAVKQLDTSDAKSIVCLVGPPGVGKTSIARSIAEAMKRKLYHFSVGGMRDEAEIKGHRRTYIGAMPGKIIQGLLYVKEKDPIFVIDEIDKLANSYRGDPSSALLEVLDPVQNTHFRDLYMDVPFDLSKIFFITTANTLHNIPKPLIDRMEVIQLSGYIDEEKVSIAQKYIVPRSLKTHGLKKGQVKFSTKTLRYIAEHYAREAGMRIFEQHINKIVRKIATDYVQQKELAPKSNKTKNYFPISIEEAHLETYLGLAPFRTNLLTVASTPGTSVGLAWTSAGGDVLTIEALAVKGKAGFKLTGTLGDVMKESAQISYTLVKQYIDKLQQENHKIEGNFFKINEIHLHVPEGATPKDGPSAGITMSTALLSLALNTTITSNFAMTGEVSLAKRVLPIGGLREKIVAARRNTIKNIIIPHSNLSDLVEIPEYIKKNINIYPVQHLDEVFSLMFPKIDFHVARPKKYEVNPTHNLSTAKNTRTTKRSK